MDPNFVAYVKKLHLKVLFQCDAKSLDITVIIELLSLH